MSRQQSFDTAELYDVTAASLLGLYIPLYAKRSSNKYAPIYVVSDFLLIGVDFLLGQRRRSSDYLNFAWTLTLGAVGRRGTEHHSYFMYLVCWGTEVVAPIYYLRNLVTQKISLRLRSAVFKPLYTTRAIEKALGHQRKFDPLCLEALLYGVLVAINKVSAKD